MTIKEDENYMNSDDVIFSKDENGNIMSGGFCINSLFLKNNMTSPIETMNIIGGEKDCNVFNFNSDVNFKNVVVPFGLFYKQEKMLKSSLGKLKKEIDVEDDDEINDSIYDELLNMIQIKENNNKSNSIIKNKTKKANPILKNKTKKNKNV